MKISIIKACSDLGVHISGSELGPLKLDNFDNLVDNVLIVKKEATEKELDRSNKRKNFNELNKFNEKLYNTILNEKDNFILTIGGDHSIVIASALANKKIKKNIGIIWIDSHADFHNFSTTISGNIHGMPFATICGENGNELSYFFDEEYFNPNNAVLVGARDVESPEYTNLKKAGVKIFTTNDIVEKGPEFIMESALNIALNGTDSVHISYDLDVIDPKIAPGVSIKAVNGITENDAYQILETIIKYKEKISSFDLVELNPNYDTENKTYNIASSMLKELINALKKMD